MEIKIEDLIKKEHCKKYEKISSVCRTCPYPNDDRDPCRTVIVILSLLKDCTITRKTNVELAEEKYQNGLKLADNGLGDLAIEDFIEAYELLKKGDE